MKGTSIREPQKTLTERPKASIDFIVGKQRPGPVDLDWNGCPLAMHYPRWDMFHEALYYERKEAAEEGRKPHKAARLQRGHKSIAALREYSVPAPSSPAEPTLSRCRTGSRAFGRL